MRLAFTDVGSGPAVVLIHGLGGSREIFTELMAALGSGVRCVAIDLPDMGESGAWASQSPGEIAVALQTFLRSRGIERAVVVGHSYGGLTAMEFAARFPAAVTKTPRRGLRRRSSASEAGDHQASRRGVSATPLERNHGAH